MQNFLGALELAEPHEDLSERGERNGEPASGPHLFLQRRTVLGHGERLLMAVLEQRHVRLVVADDTEDILRLHRRRESLGVLQRGIGFFDAPALSEHSAGEGVEDCKVAAIARGMQRRRRFRDVFPHDRRVADLPVAEPQLVMREADRLGIVRLLRVLSARPSSAIARDWSPFANAMRP